jgi:tetratricopeptide (TPR) repeat protein
MRITALIVAAGIVTAAPLRAQSVAEQLSAGVAARAARDPAAAVTHFQAALAQDSLNYAANWEAALALIDVGKATPDSVKSPARDSLYALAEVYARRAVAANPGDAEGHFALANAVGRASLTKSKQERIRRAVEIRSEALRAIELDPRHDGAYHVLGRWNAEIMRLSGMTRFLARNFLGAAIFKEASWEGAVTNMEKAVELDPRRIYHRLDLAEVYVNRHRFADARSQLQQIALLPVSDVLDPTYKEQAAELLRRIADRKDS